MITCVNHPDFGEKGRGILFDCEKIRQDYDYAGLWYARDKAGDRVSVTTNIFTNVSMADRIPVERISIPENSFKQEQRVIIDLSGKNKLIAMTADGEVWCDLLLEEPFSEKMFIKYRKIANSRNNFTVRENGVFRGGQSVCYKVRVEDNISERDFDDVLMYLVLLKDIPPASWKLDHLCYGVQRVPVMVKEYVFDERFQLETWAGMM